MLNVNDEVKVQIFGREFEGTITKVETYPYTQYVVNIPHVGEVVTIPEQCNLASQEA